MLSRSNSNAAEKLRRAKSSSSTHTTSLGRHRASIPVDPIIIRQQAEAAAAEAYKRGCILEQPANVAVRATRPALQRRRSIKTGRTEGSHFEDARLGRRRSMVGKPDRELARPPMTQTKHEPALKSVNNDSGEEEKVVTRKRSVIPSSFSQDQRYSCDSTPPLVNHWLRKARSTHPDGSSTLRHATAVNSYNSTRQLPSSVSDNTDGYGGSLAHLSEFGESAAQLYQSPRPSIRETQTDEEILALARDRCLLDFQQNHKVRERKSFILAPFQRRRATAMMQKNGDVSYDNCLPPFNYADDSTMSSLPPAPDPVSASHTVVRPQKKTRTFSDTLKGRFTKVFRKVSKTSPRLPVQHVEAKHFHYAASEEAYHSLSEKAADPFRSTTANNTTAMVQTAIPKDASANSRTSGVAGSDAKSRVTSWANSTVAGTCTSRRHPDHPHAVDEHGGLRTKASMGTLRKASSFFGGPVLDKLRRASKSELKSSEESQALYSALQDRIMPFQRTETLESTANSRSHWQTQSALASLPSQQQASSNAYTDHQSEVGTIRPVTPDPIGHRLDLPSPVAEVLSPESEVHQASDENENHEHTPYSLRPPAIKAAPPTQEQIAYRNERSKNRWQSQLDGTEPPVRYARRALAMDDNPYELPSLTRGLAQNSGVPHNAETYQKFGELPRALLSPSLYSRASDGASPRPATPIDGGSMVVKIIGHEVRSYSISPPKERQQKIVQPTVQTSGQWRRWLSGELDTLKAPSEAITLADVVRKESNEPALDASAYPGAILADNHLQSRRSSGSPALNTRPPLAVTTAQPRTSSWRSSFMNERYPLIEGSRNPSEQSQRSQTGSSSRVREGSSSCDSQPPKASNERQARKSSWMRPRVITGRQSIARMETMVTDQYETKQDEKDSEPPSCVPSGVDNLNQGSTARQRKTRSTDRRKSAYELRANYKNSNTGRSTPIEIHRKPIQDMSSNDIFEDTTIRNISAGPYASQSISKPANRATDASNKENTPPSEANGLPALSSSEWLGGSSTNKLRKPSAVPPVYGKRSVSRCSPTRNGKIGQGSSAQRMASQWLEKRSRETMPAFV